MEQYIVYVYESFSEGVPQCVKRLHLQNTS